MVISPGFRFEDAIRRVGGTRPAADTVIVGPTTRITLAPFTTKQFYTKMFQGESRSAAAHCRDAEVVEGQGLIYNRESSSAGAATETSRGRRPLVRRRISKVPLTRRIPSADRRRKVATPISDRSHYCRKEPFSPVKWAGDSDLPQRCVSSHWSAIRNSELVKTRLSETSISADAVRPSGYLCGHDDR